MSARLAMLLLPAAFRRRIGGTRGAGPGPPLPAGEFCRGWWPVFGRVSRKDGAAGVGIELGRHRISWLPVLARMPRQGWAFSLSRKPLSVMESYRGRLMKVLRRVSGQHWETGASTHHASVREPCRVLWPDVGRVRSQDRCGFGPYVGATTGLFRGDPFTTLVTLPPVGHGRQSRGLHTGTRSGARRPLQGQGDGAGQQGASSGQRAETRTSSELDRADAWMMRKAQETGYLSWLRNGLLATGIGVITFVQSDVGREAAYGFFILGGLCLSYGTASHVANIAMLRRTMMLSKPAVLLNAVGVLVLAILWLAALSLYVGRLEVEIVRDNGEEVDEGCEHCRGHEGEEEGRGRADK